MGTPLITRCGHEIRITKITMHSGTRGLPTGFSFVFVVPLMHHPSFLNNHSLTFLSVLFLLHAPIVVRPSFFSCLLSVLPAYVGPSILLRSVLPVL
jgi:hypothetical protein